MDDTLKVDLLPGKNSTETLEALYGEDWPKVVDKYQQVQFFRDGHDAGTFTKGAPIQEE